MDLIKEFLKRSRTNRIDIVCVGDAMVDECVKVKVNRISPEFPMAIMSGTHEEPLRLPGGVANVARQLQNFNVQRELFCLPDLAAYSVFRQYNIFNHVLDHQVVAKLPIKRRFFDGIVQITRHDLETHLCGLSEDARDAYVAKVWNHLVEEETKADVIVVSDYNKGFFDPYKEFTSWNFGKATTIVDPKCGPLEKWLGCHIFKANAKEAAELTGSDYWENQVMAIRERTDCKAVVITCGGDKVVGLDEKGLLFSFEPEKKVKVESVVGAGDCFAAFFAMAIGHHFPVQDAVEIAWNAGAVYVQRSLNKPLVPSDLIQDKLVEWEDLVKRDFTVALVDGCFEHVEASDIEQFEEAKKHADKLVVAVRTNSMVDHVRNNDLSVYCECIENRKAVVAALECVDFVVDMNEADNYELSQRIRPEFSIADCDC